MGPLSRLVALLLSVFVLLVGARPALAQAPVLDDGSTEAERPPFQQAELDQLLASIALYPDPLLSQMLMAATYPLEIVQADRWLQSSGRPTGEALARDLKDKPWDASVKALTSFPDVLAMMSEELDWTVKLGDAFLGQEQAVLATIQRLRAKARAEGNLKTTEQQIVSVESVDGPSPIIVIEPADPDVIYIPAYDPWVTYGTWWAPAYAPHYHPLPWFWGGAGISFGVGIGLGPSWGYAWGYPDWRHRHVTVDPHRHARRHRHIAPHIRRLENEHHVSRRVWSHQPAHRQGVPYRNHATVKRLDRGGDALRVRSPSVSRGSLPRADSPSRVQRGPRVGQRGPRVNAPTRLQTSPRLQGPSRVQRGPRVNAPTRLQTSPRLQGPTRVQRGPRVNAPTRLQTSPRLQGPTRVQAAPRLQSPPRASRVRPSGPVFRGGSRSPGPTFRGAPSVRRSVGPAMRGGGGGRVGPRGGGRR